MKAPINLIATISLTIASGLLVLPAPASALTSQECSAKYQAAKTAGTLNGASWNDFRKAQCADAAATTPAAAPAAPAPKEAKSDKPAAKPAAAPVTVSVGNATFPTAVDSKFAKEPAAKARLHTCAESWKANKTASTTGGLRWIQKGGGYWSECNKRLKGA